MCCCSLFTFISIYCETYFLSAYTGKPINRTANGDKYERKDVDKSGHKSLQEYVKQVQKTQRGDTVGLEVTVTSFDTFLKPLRILNSLYIFITYI